jgi:hypothetical protein
MRIMFHLRGRTCVREARPESIVYLGKLQIDLVERF